jgi:DNA-binding transcriptional regulator PaaX
MKYFKSEIMKEILGIIAAAGVLGLALIGPGPIAILLKSLSRKKMFNQKQIKRSMDSLKNNDLISMSYEGNKTVIRLTKSGKEKLLKYKIDDMKIKPQKKWDKKWRLVIFDIPKSFGKTRLEFTRKLRDIGFVLLQKSVWVCPYPCEDEIDFLKEAYHVRPFVRIIIAEQIDIAEDLRKKFNLHEVHI